jgi:hypothetical protein
MAAEIPTFEDSVDLLRERIRDADAINPGELHSFKTLMADHADVLSDNWYWEAFEELQALSHLDVPASGLAMGGDAHGRLSAEGRYYLRSLGDES